VRRSSPFRQRRQVGTCGQQEPGRDAGDHTVAWGIGYLVEAGLRVAIVATTSTGIALVCSKTVPYLFAVTRSGWTLGYGEHEKRKAERTARPIGLGRHRGHRYKLDRCPAR
jgi:hypothetical protein